jgi:uncharacterized protein
MNSKLIFADHKNLYFQDLVNNFLIFLPDGLSDALQSNIVKKNSYYQKKAKFLLDHLSNERTVEDNYSGRLTPQFIKKALINTRQLTFELTENCNLRCKYCGYGELYGDYGNRDNKDLPWEYVDATIKYLKGFWESNEFPSFKKRISIGFYGGEPLLKMDLIKKIVGLLEQLDKNQFSFSYNITTNGTLLDRYMDFLVKKGVQISISLDGNILNNEYRLTKSGNNSHKSVVENINKLKKCYPPFFDKNVHFISVLHDKNSVKDICNFFKTNYNKTPTILEVNPDGIKKEMLEEYNKIYNNKNKSLNDADNSDEIKKQLFIEEPNVYTLMHYLHAYSGNVIKDYAYFFHDKESTKWLPTGTCVPFGKRIFVTATGKILPCERIGHQYAIGSVNENGVKIDFEKIANRYNEYYDSLFRDCCSNCYGLKHCLVCIFNLENRIEKKPKCKRQIDEKQFQEYMSNNISLLRREPEMYSKIMTKIILE